jgi:hypothetical protein
MYRVMFCWGNALRHDVWRRQGFHPLGLNMNTISAQVEPVTYGLVCAQEKMALDATCTGTRGRRRS